MKRWWPLILFAVVWLAVLLSPRSRDFPRAVLYPWPGSQGAIPAVYSDEAPETEASYVLARARLGEIEAFYPQDKRVMLGRAVLGEPKEVEKQLAALAAKYPDDVLILVARLENLASLAIDYRNRQVFGTPVRSPRRIQPRLRPEQKAILDRLLTLSRHGQKLAPANQYFDWFVMYALFALRRDVDAFAILPIAAKKPEFRDYVPERLVAFHEARELERCLSVREANDVWNGISFSHFTRFHTVARLICERAHLMSTQQRDGEQLRLSRNLLLLGRQMRLKATSLMGMLVAKSIENYALQLWTPASPIPVPRAGPLVPLNQKSRSNLAGLAFALNDQSTVQLAQSEWAVLYKWTGVKWPSTSWAGYEPRHGVVLKVVERATQFIWSFTPWVFMLGVAVFLLSRFPRLRAEVPVRIPQRAELWGGFTGLFSLAVLLFADAAVILRSEPALGEPPAESYITIDGLHTAADEWIVGVPLILLATIALAAACFWQQRARPQTRSWKEDVTRISGEDSPASVFVGVVFPGLAFVSLLTANLALGFYIFGHLDLNKVSEQSRNLLLLSGAIWIVPLFTRLMALPNQRVALNLGLRTLTHACFGFLLWGGITYGLVLLAMMPYLSAYDANLHQALARGEMASMRAAVGL